jgi:uncharacterized glyoxalase superfamily protein PhnB
MKTVARHTMSTIVPALRYLNAPEAIEWLCNVLGFERHAIFEGPNGTIAHAELTLNGGMVMLGSQKNDELGRTLKSPKEFGGVGTCSMYVIVPNADDAFRRAQKAGAKILRAVEDTHYGTRDFMVEDLEGHTWSVGTYDPWLKRE